ncbi:MAG: lipid-A-disaccharide synthase [Gammaproteobacteria bacterium]
MSLKIALIAGEASGDQLGAHLIEALRARCPGIEIIGVAGTAMRAAGCRPLADVDDMSVMGFAELAVHLPRLLALRRQLIRALLAMQPDLVVGIDVPDFNLGLERRLRKQGLATAHYVSPSVWAWRAGRVHAVAAAAKCVLCLLPFEPECYRELPIKAVFVGHPLADMLVPLAREEARRRLCLEHAGRLLAVLPGSRTTEVKRLAPVFVAAAAELARTRDDLKIVIPLARPTLKPLVEAALRPYPRLVCSLVEGSAHAAIGAADAVLTASGTATLETMLLERPMVVAYRLQPVSAWLLRRSGLLQTRHFALPNLIAGRGIVPELLQEDASVAKIIAAVGSLLDDAGARDAQLAAFAALRGTLGGGAAARAADVLLRQLAIRGTA